MILLWLAHPAAAKAESAHQPTIAIIIDDLGNHLDNGQQLIDLPYPLTLSFLPKRPFTQQLSKRAHEVGKEIMLHAPMENTKGLKLGYGALTNAMNEAQIKQTIIESLHAVPHISGVNNHMGSMLTQNPEAMRWIMEELNQHPYYFVDSRTTAQSVAYHEALKHQIPSLNRDVFLDHEQTWDYFDTQFKHLLDLARKNGTAIAIAHPHAVSIRYLETMLPRLDETGIRIATVSALWQINNPHQVMFAQRKTAIRLARRDADTSSVPATP